MNHRVRSRLDLTFPDTSNRVLARQAASVDRDMSQEDTGKFYSGDPVQVMNFVSSLKWVARVLEERLGPTTFTVRLPDGRLWKRHLDHIRHRLPMERGDEVTSSQQSKLAEDHRPQQQRLPELKPPSTATSTTSEAPDSSLSKFAFHFRSTNSSSGALGTQQSSCRTPLWQIS